MSFQFKDRNDSAYKARGYFGIAIWNPKYESNIGVLLRSSAVFDASFMATIGQRRYKNQKCDTMKSWKHVPLYHYESFEDFKKHLPKECMVVGVELTQTAIDTKVFSHPERAVYLFGSEDSGLPFHIQQQCDALLKIETPLNISMNVSVAGSIILYDRMVKSK
jgi:tRNA(Leu) C34 or U34 (ribose-2'-O)-methylase TrmL